MRKRWRRIGSHREGHRYARLLQKRRVGYPRSAGTEENQEVPVLPRTVPRHHLLHHHAEKDLVPHGQSYHSVRCHFVPYRARILPSVRQWREDYFVYLHSALTHRVLPAPGRDYSADVHCGAADREVSPLHHDSRDAVHLRDSGGTERSLPVAIYACHVTLGQESVPQHIAQIDDYAPTEP